MAHNYTKFWPHYTTPPFWTHFCEKQTWMPRTKYSSLLLIGYFCFYLTQLKFVSRLLCILIVWRHACREALIGHNTKVTYSITTCLNAMFSEKFVHCAFDTEFDHANLILCHCNDNEHTKRRAFPNAKNLISKARDTLVIAIATWVRVAVNYGALPSEPGNLQQCHPYQRYTATYRHSTTYSGERTPFSYLLWVHWQLGVKQNDQRCVRCVLQCWLPRKRFSNLYKGEHVPSKVFHQSATVVGL